MFDFRYHVVSLAAVFLALVVGIVVGVGLSGQGIVQESERENLNRQIAELNAEVDQKDTELEQRQTAERFVDASYPAVMEGRLAGKRIAVVFVGPADRTRGAIEQTITDAGGTLVRLRVLKMPVDDAALARTIDGSSDLSDLASADDPGDIGRVLGRELLEGGDAPLWDGVAGQLVIERNPDASAPADAVVVVRTADPQQGATARFLGGLYAGLTSGSEPAVWVDVSDTAEEPMPHPSGFSALRGVDTALGRVTLAVLLETGDQGEYGPGTDTPVPAIAPVPAATEPSG
jgi:Copper transport outer membrane protein, MctB